MAVFDTLVITDRAPGVAQVTMARPAVFNAFDEAMIAELDTAFARLSEDDAVRVVVLAGEGRHFSAGADLQWMRRASEASVEWNVQDARRFAGMLARIEACAKPVVARVQGAALGGGVGLACACDLPRFIHPLGAALVARNADVFILRLHAADAGVVEKGLGMRRDGAGCEQTDKCETFH